MTNIVPPQEGVNSPPVFKSEHSLWLMLVSGEKTWEARRYDMTDDRINRLTWSRDVNGAPGNHIKGFKDVGPHLRLPEVPLQGHVPVETEVGFLDKQTGQHAFFEYKGMEFVAWEPGWCFLQLGKRSRSLVLVTEQEQVQRYLRSDAGRYRTALIRIEAHSNDQYAKDVAGEALL